MDSHLSQDSLDQLFGPAGISQPPTPSPELSQSSMPEDVSKTQSDRIESSQMTPPPSTQVPASSRGKARTPTPSISHISTPPPTVEGADQLNVGRIAVEGDGALETADWEAASPEELRVKVTELQAAVQEAKMAAAHHKLQLQMLQQESVAQIERMVVEAHMVQSENDIIQSAEQAKAAATPVRRSPSDGMIPVHKDLYSRMVHDIQMLREANAEWKAECERRDQMIGRQDNEIASLTDKVTLMRERIRENREHLNRYRLTATNARVDSTPRSFHTTPHRGHVSSKSETQPFAALLQASEMASKESARSGRGGANKKGHARNQLSTSSLPVTPHRSRKAQPAPYSTPRGQQRPLKVPSTAPIPRTSDLRTPDIYGNASAARNFRPAPPQSEGTVSASEDNDSEAETDIIEPAESVSESQASRAASQMLRASQGQQQVTRESFRGRGMLEGTGGRLKQKLFGAVASAEADMNDGPPTKRARLGEPAVGLGIAGIRR